MKIFKCPHGGRIVAGFLAFLKPCNLEAMSILELIRSLQTN